MDKQYKNKTHILKDKSIRTEENDSILKDFIHLTFYNPLYSLFFISDLLQNANSQKQERVNNCEK